MAGNGTRTNRVASTIALAHDAGLLEDAALRWNSAFLHATALLIALVLLALCARPASAQQLSDDSRYNARVAFSPFVLTTPPLDEDGHAFAGIHGLTRKISPRWKASYGVGSADETDLTSSLLRYDQTLGYGTRSDHARRDSWRHFLGVEYEPIRGFSLLGGIGKTGARWGGFSPTGYEKLRVNAGARWRGESWGVDGSVSFIPTGASRYPGGYGYLPGFGDSGDSGGATYLFSLTVSRQF